MSYRKVFKVWGFLYTLVYSGLTSSLGIWRCEVSGEPVGLRTVKKGSIQRYICREAKLTYKLPRIMTKNVVK